MDLKAKVRDIRFPAGRDTFRDITPLIGRRYIHYIVDAFAERLSRWGWTPYLCLMQGGFWWGRL
jgi:adenine/guanine phosphoribosyltransferase-like PRPP-binding protein